MRTHEFLVSGKNVTMCILYYIYVQMSSHVSITVYTNVLSSLRCIRTLKYPFLVTLSVGFYLFNFSPCTVNNSRRFGYVHTNSNYTQNMVTEINCGGVRIEGQLILPHLYQTTKLLSTLKSHKKQKSDYRLCSFYSSFFFLFMVVLFSLTFSQDEVVCTQREKKNPWL